MAAARTLDRRVRQVMATHGPIVRTGHLLDAGIHPRDLYALRDGGQLEVVARGVYRLASAPLPPHLDLLVVAMRCPHAVVCLISALAFHEMTDEIPHEVSIAVRRGAAAPRLDYPPLRVFWFSAPAYQLGIERHPIDGIDLKVYSPTRSVVDAFRFRNRIGEDVAIKALAHGLRSRRVRPGPLLELAAKLRARAVIEPYLKALT